MSNRKRQKNNVNLGTVLNSNEFKEVSKNFKLKFIYCLKYIKENPSVKVYSILLFGLILLGVNFTSITLITKSLDLISILDNLQVYFFAILGISISAGLIIWCSIASACELEQAKNQDLSSILKSNKGIMRGIICIIYIAVIILGIYFLILGNIKKTSINQYHPIEAKVNQYVEVQDDNGNNGFNHIYIYEVEQKLYQFQDKTFVLRSQLLPIGNTKIIYYNPQNPNDLFNYSTQNILFLISYILLITAVCILLYELSALNMISNAIFSSAIMVGFAIIVIMIPKKINNYTTFHQLINSQPWIYIFSFLFYISAIILWTAFISIFTKNKKLNTKNK